MNHSLSGVINSASLRIHGEMMATRLLMTLGSHLAPAWTARSAAQRFITPPKIHHTPRELKSLGGGLRLSVPSPMGPLAVWRFGNLRAPAIILSHGWGGRGGQFREWITPLMAAGYQVVLFDHAGHGFSAGREAPITDFARGVTAVTRFIEADGVDIAGFVGHSLGNAGVGIALRHELKRLQSARVVQIAPPASLIRYSRFFAKTLGLSERIRAAMQWRLEQKIGVNWQEFEMPHAAASLSAPALIIHDQNDRDVRIESGLAVARAWPNARFKRTFGLGHRQILRDATVIAAAADFLQDRVVFPLPPKVDEWSLAFNSLSGAAPLY